MPDKRLPWFLGESSLGHPIGLFLDSELDPPSKAYTVLDPQRLQALGGASLLTAPTLGCFTIYWAKLE